jgi:hypothetical protein
MATTPACPGDADTQEQAALLQALVATVQHFFGGFPALFRGVTDPRPPALITYPLAAVLTAGLLLFCFRLGARRQIGCLLRRNGPSAAKFEALFGVPACPHGDTVAYLGRQLAVTEVQAAVTGLTETLIRRKVLYRYRLLDEYFLVVIDGTGMLTFTERHCPHCLTRTVHGRTLYYHPVLEAKLVTPTGWVFSLLTEFIENPAAYPTKQDCELKAFYRLAARLKHRFPRLPLCLLLDSLFAGGPTFSICERYRWQYLIVLQEGDLPTVHQEFAALTQLAPEDQLVFRTGVQRQIHQDFRWVNDIAYVDAEHHEHTVAVLQCLETKPDAQGQRTTTRFKWITNFHVTAQRVVTLANDGGRLRWKIENEGFNVQKNGGYALEHVYCAHPTAGKVFYLLLQMAHLLAQLLEHGRLLRQAVPAGVGSAKNLAFRLLEAWRNLRLSTADFHQWTQVRGQIRFDSS